MGGFLFWWEPSIYICVFLCYNYVSSVAIHILCLKLMFRLFLFGMLSVHHKDGSWGSSQELFPPTFILWFEKLPSLPSTLCLNIYRTFKFCWSLWPAIVTSIRWSLVSISWLVSAMFLVYVFFMATYVIHITCEIQKREQRNPQRQQSKYTCLESRNPE